MAATNGVRLLPRRGGDVDVRIDGLSVATLRPTMTPAIDRATPPVTTWAVYLPDGRQFTDKVFQGPNARVDATRWAIERLGAL